jgi:hypothetical protein
MNGKTPVGYVSIENVREGGIITPDDIFITIWYCMYFYKVQV